MSSPASRPISESPDDQQFEEIYSGIPLGLTVPHLNSTTSKLFAPSAIR
jgi:hypothetical protein